jgi:hypothetical protein
MSSDSPDNNHASDEHLFEFRLPSESSPIDPSRLALAIRLLSWTFFPFSTCQIQRSTTRQAPIPVYVPPPGFAYPLDGLLPLNPSELYLTLAALLGFPLRSFTLRSRITEFPLQLAHVLFLLKVIPMSSLVGTALQTAAPGHFH